LVGSNLLIRVEELDKKGVGVMQALLTDGLKQMMQTIEVNRPMVCWIVRKKELATSQ